VGDLDSAAKELLREEAAALIRLAFPALAIRAVTFGETEIHRLERRMDKLACVEVVGEPEPVPFHVEVEAVWASDVPEKTFDKWALLRTTHPLVRSLVIVLQPGERQGDPRGSFEVFSEGAPLLTFRFALIRAWDLSVSEILGTGEPGLIPLVPFAKDATRERTEVAQRVLLDEHRERTNLHLVYSVFADWIFPDEDWEARIPEEIRMESAVFRRIREIGAADVLSGQLRRRLGKSKKTEALLARLKTCDAKTADKLSRLILQTKSKPELYAAVDRLLKKA